MLGDNRVALQCFDGVARTGLIRGTMRRRVWINTVCGMLLSFQSNDDLTRQAHVFLG